MVYYASERCSSQYLTVPALLKQVGRLTPHKFTTLSTGRLRNSASTAPRFPDLVLYYRFATELRQRLCCVNIICAKRTSGRHPSSHGYYHETPSKEMASSFQGPDSPVY